MDRPPRKCLTPRCLGKHCAKGRCKRCYTRLYMREYSQRPANKKYRRQWKKLRKVRGIVPSRPRGVAVEPGLRAKCRAVGISVDTYNKMLREQGGRCAICRKTPREIGGKAKRLSIDHCHKTSRVRGLLCNGCNRGIGFLMEDRAVVLRAASYLRKYKSA